jgi:cytochrome c553
MKESTHMKNINRTLFGLVSIGASVLLIGCSWFNDKPPVTTFENPSRSRTIEDYPVNGKVLAQQVCAACHGIDGQATSPIFPKLAGQQKDYFVVQMNSFRDHSRSDKYAIAYMWGMARLSDDQISVIADYYASQAPMKGEEINSPELAHGKEIFEKGIPAIGLVACSTCHGPTGSGNAEIPRIAGQHSEYIYKQVVAFQHPEETAIMEMGGKTWEPKDYELHRNLTHGAAMNAVVSKMSDADIRAIALYLNSLNPS